jgi:hypothetical protein
LREQRPVEPFENYYSPSRGLTNQGLWLEAAYPVRIRLKGSLAPTKCHPSQNARWPYV